MACARSNECGRGAVSCARSGICLGTWRYRITRTTPISFQRFFLPLLGTALFVYSPSSLGRACERRLDHSSVHPQTCSPLNILRSSTPALLRLRPPSPDVSRPRDLPLPLPPSLPLLDPSYRYPTHNPPPPPLPSPPRHRQPLPLSLLPLTNRATSCTTTPAHHHRLAPRLYLASTNTLHRIFSASLPLSSNRSSMQTMSYQSLRHQLCPHRQPTSRSTVIRTPPSGHPLLSHPA